MEGFIIDSGVISCTVTLATAPILLNAACIIFWIIPALGPPLLRDAPPCGGVEGGELPLLGLFDVFETLP